MNKDMTVPCEDGIINLRVGAIIMMNGKILMVGNDRADYLYSVGGRIKFLMRFFPDLVRCMPVAENSPRTLIRWVEKELLNLLTGRYRSTADDFF